MFAVVDDECTAHDEWGPKELVDGADSFGDEQSLSFASMPSLEITRSREHAHGAGLEVEYEPEFAFCEPN
jgi:hypothetical protein